MTANAAGTTASTAQTISARRRWAAEQLGVAAEAQPRDARRGFQRLLIDADFVPPESWRAAFDELCGAKPASNPPDAYLCDLQPQLREELEAFAQRMLSLSPDERNSQYDALQRQCDDFPRLAKRLHSLTTLLHVNLNQIPADAPLMRQLAGQLAQLAVLKPLDRAVARQAMIREPIAKFEVLEYVARTLKKTHPEITSLAPELIDDLLKQREMLKRVGAFRKHGMSQKAQSNDSSHPLATWIWRLLSDSYFR